MPSPNCAPVAPSPSPKKKLFVKKTVPYFAVSYENQNLKILSAGLKVLPSFKKLKYYLKTESVDVDRKYRLGKDLMDITRQEK